MFVTVNGKAGLIVSEDGTIGTEMLVNSSPIFPEFREIPPQWQIVEGQLQCGVGIGAKTRGCRLLSSQATANLVPPLKYANAHLSILSQVHGKE
jgi:hypothetical protein